MESPTFAERAAEDGITLRPVLMGIIENRNHKPQFAVWTYLLFNRATYDPVGPTYLHLADDGRDDPEWSTNGYYGTALSVGTFEAAYMQSSEGGPVQPTVDEALDEVCRIAADIENYPDFTEWLSNQRGEDASLSIAEFRQQQNMYEEHRVIWRKVREFLGEKFGDYISNTEWQ